MGFMTALAVTAVASTAGSLYYQRRAAREQARMNEFQRRQADLQAARQRRDTIRANRIAAASQMITAEGQNVNRSSGAMGGLDSIISQGVGNLSFMDRMNTLSDQASAAYGRAIRYGNIANTFSGIASLAMAFYNPVTKPNEATGAVGGNKPPGAGGAAPITYKGSSPYTRPHSGNPFPGF